MNTVMRAKMRIETVKRYEHCEVIELHAVSKSTNYPADGFDEDNTYAKFSPSGSITLTIANPALRGKFQPGEKFYLDFTQVV